MQVIIPAPREAQTLVERAGLVMLLAALGLAWMAYQWSGVPIDLGQPAVALRDVGAGTTRPVERQAHAYPHGAPRVAWQMQTGGAIYAAPAIEGDTVYVASLDGAVHAVDIATGAERWRYLSGTALSTAPAVFDDRVFVARQGGIVVALDAATGRVLWEEETVARPAGSPVAAFGLLLVASGLSPVPPAAGEDLIYAAGGRGERALQAFDPRTGEERWRTGLPRDGIYALDPVTGRERWLLDSPAMVSVSPEVRGSDLYAVDRMLYRVYAGGGELWHADLAEQTPRGLAAGDQGIYVAGDTSAALVDGMGQVEGWLAAFDAEDGEQRWRVSIGGPAWAAPVVADDLVFIGGYDGVVYAFDAATGAARWRLTVEPGRPLATAAIADGLLVIGNDGGTLTAIVEGGDAGPVRANGLVHSHPAM